MKRLLLASAILFIAFVVDPASHSAQGPEADYSKFLHNSQKHASLSCNSCHQRTDNSAAPKFPGHSACQNCHIGQFTTPQIPMCTICHIDVNGNRPPLKNFATSFKESFNLKFDHAQHLQGAAKPQAGCNGCHAGLVNRGFGLSIPSNIAAHNVCYTCHKPDAKSNAGREIASCGVCHGQGAYTPTSANSRVFRYSFSHARHGSKEKLTCEDCHRATAGLPQTKQVSSPGPFEHFPTGRGASCSTCHNGKRAFGGDLGFDSCKRCHTGRSFSFGVR